MGMLGAILHSFFLNQYKYMVFNYILYKENKKITEDGFLVLYQN